MTNNGGGSGQQQGQTDRAWPETVQWRSGIGVPVNETLWRCDAMRAGRLYASTLFDSREEADEFVLKMRDAEPDQFFNVEAIKASTVWN